MKTRHYTVEVTGPNGPEELSGDYYATSNPSDVVEDIVTDHATDQGVDRSRYLVTDYWHTEENG